MELATAELQDVLVVGSTGRGIFENIFGPAAMKSRVALVSVPSAPF